MKRKRLWAGAAALLAVGISASVAIPSLVGKKGEEPLAEQPESAAITTTERMPTYYANTVIPNSDNTKLGTYKGGDSFWYTSYAEGLRLDAQETGVATDRITETVVSDALNAPGSMYNPWVINSTADWTKFVAYVAGVKSGNVNTYGAGEYFYLNCDLDYGTYNESGELTAKTAIEPVAIFAGTFYGGSHTIKNARINAPAGDSYRVALFAAIRGDEAYISDLNVQNYTINTSNWNAGGIVGTAFRTISLVNCMATGDITMTIATNPSPAPTSTADDAQGNSFYYFPMTGGVLSGLSRNGSKSYSVSAYLYKCSAKYTLNLSFSTGTANNVWPTVGTLIGSSDSNDGRYVNASRATIYGILQDVHVYDCYGAVECTYDSKSFTSKDTRTGASNLRHYFGGMIGFTRGTNSIKAINSVSIQNLTTDVNPASTYPSCTMAHLTTIGQLQQAANVVETNNFYSYANMYTNYSGTMKQYSVPFIGGYDANCQISGNSTIVNSCGYSGNETANRTLNRTDFPSYTADQAMPNTLSIFLGEIKDGLDNESIWATDFFDNVTSSAGTPDIFDVPMLVNKTRITYLDYDNQPITQFETNMGNPVDYFPEDADSITPLPRPAASANHQFEGWTLDRTSDATIFTTFPKNLYGNVTMYPVWNMTGVNVEIECLDAANPANSYEVTDSSDPFKYTGMDLIKLNCKITSAGGLTAGGYTATYQWYRGGALIPGATSKEITIKDTTEAGIYYVEVSIVCSTAAKGDVLYRTKTPARSNQLNIRIDKGDLTPYQPATISLKTDATVSTAYYGQPVNQFNITAYMENENHITVGGTAEWMVLSDTNKVKDTTATYKATFTPTDAAHYNSREIDVIIQPQYIYLKFDLNPAIKKSFDVVLVYNEEYTADDIKDMFNAEYLPWLAALTDTSTIDTVQGKTPLLNGARVNDFTCDDLRATATTTINVTFEPNNTTYNVVFHVPNSSNVYTSTNTQTVPVHFGQILGESDIPEVNNTNFPEKHIDAVKQGWYLDEACTEVWDDSVGISDNLNVYAKVYLGVLKLASISTVTPLRIFETHSTPVSSDFEVKGLYNLYNKTSGSFEQSDIELPLAPTEYTVATVGTLTVGNTGKGAVNITTVSSVVTVSGSLVTKSNVEVSVYVKRIDISDITVDKEQSTRQIAGKDNYSVTIHEKPGSASELLSTTFVYSYYNAGGQYLGQERYAAANGAQDSLVEGFQGVQAVGTYTVILSVDFGAASTEYVADTINIRFTLRAKPTNIMVVWKNGNAAWTEGDAYTYNGKVQHPTATFYRAHLNETNPENKFYEPEGNALQLSFDYTGDGATAVAAKANYTIGVNLAESTLNYYELVESAITQTHFTINKARAVVPMLADGRNTFEYTGNPYDIRDYLTWYDGALVNVSNPVQTDVKATAITSVVTLIDPNNTIWVSDLDSDAPLTVTSVSLSWRILPKSLAIPTFDEIIVYDGFEKDIRDYLSNYDPVIEISEENRVRTDADTYVVYLSLPSSNRNYEWADGSTDSQRVEWTIQKAKLYLSWNKNAFVVSATGASYAPTARIASGLIGLDKKINSPELALIYSGDIEKTDVGAYVKTARLDTRTEWTKNYQLDATSSVWNWAIKGSESTKLVTVIWNLPEGGFVYNAESQYPTVLRIEDENGDDVSDQYYVVGYTGARDAMFAGSYKIGVQLAAIDGSDVMIFDQETPFIIRPNSAGEGVNNNVNTDNEQKPDGAEGDKPEENTVQVPLWQVAVSGVSIVIILACCIKSFSELGRSRDASKKAKELSKVSYSFAGLPLLMAFLGMEDNNWTVLAAVLAVVAVLSIVLMVVATGKRRRAEEALATQEKRVAEEKEAAKEAAQAEEARRRDEDMKMMFAGLLQSQTQQQQQMALPSADDVVNRVVAALMPAMQQQAALPPTSSEAAPQPLQLTEQASSVTEERINELEARLARQQEEALKMQTEMLARQQAMFEQMLAQQRPVQQPQYVQQTPPAPSQPVTAPPAEKPAASDDDDGPERLTLAEAYEQLQDNAKLLFDEVCDYVASKPETFRNDGKYAISFKYRAKPLFKLVIKRGVPTVCYSTEGEMLRRLRREASAESGIAMHFKQSEVPLLDSSTMDLAKEVVQLRIQQIDQDIEYAKEQRQAKKKNS